MATVYHKVLKLNMFYFFKETYAKFLPSFFIAMIIGLVLEHFNPLPHGYFRFVINGLLFVAAFMFLVYFKLNEYEKNLLFNKFKKIIKRW